MFFWGFYRAVEWFASEITELMIIFVSLSGTNSSNQRQSVSASFVLLMGQWWQKAFLISLKSSDDWQSTPQQIFWKEKNPEVSATKVVTNIPAEVRGALHFYVTA